MTCVCESVIYYIVNHLSVYFFLKKEQTQDNYFSFLSSSNTIIMTFHLACFICFSHLILSWNCHRTRCLYNVGMFVYDLGTFSSSAAASSSFLLHKSFQHRRVWHWKSLHFSLDPFIHYNTRRKKCYQKCSLIFLMVCILLNTCSIVII